MELSFKTFLQQEAKGAAHLAALDQELGADPEAFAADPKIGSFFGMGNGTFNLSPFKIVSFEYGPDGKTPILAKVKVMNLKGVKRRKFITIDGKSKQIKDDPAGEPSKIYSVRVDSSGKPDEKDLQDILTKGMNPADMGGMGGPPGGGMGGPPGMPPM